MKYLGLFTNILWGSDANEKNFVKMWGLQTLTNFTPLPLSRKLWGNTTENHVNSIGTRKFVLIFFKTSLSRVKNLKAPLLHQAPLEGVVNGP